MTALIFSFLWILLMILMLSVNLLFGKPPIQGGCNSVLCRESCRKACPHKAARK